MGSYYYVDASGNLKVEWRDLIIRGLMKIGKSLLVGAGLKDAVVQINQTI